MKQYDESAIGELEDIDHMRLRPSAYIPNTGNKGIFTIIREIVDNSVDELSVVGSGLIHVIMFVNKDQSNFEVVVYDTGRGVPIGKMISVFSSSKVSGKFSTDHYQFSGGLFGFGSTVCLALSSWFRAISMKNGDIGDTTMRYDNIPKEPIIVSNKYQMSGTIVSFSPDKTIFNTINDFINNYENILINYLQQLSLFANYQIKFTLVEHSIPTRVKKNDTYTYVDYIHSIINNKADYDSYLLDKDNFIKQYFNVNKTWDSFYNLSGVSEDGKLIINGCIYFNTKVNFNNQKNKLTLVNNLIFDDNNSLHINLLIKFIKYHVGELITDNKAVKDFFINIYKLPIWFVLDVKFSGAQFSGFAKISFDDNKFTIPYNTLLFKIFTRDVFNDIYNTLKDHIDIQYSKYNNSDFKPINTKNLLAKLNRPTKFRNCLTSDKSRTELFLVEGDSAKNDQDRDPDFQATYTLGGKPFNGLTVPTKIEEAVNNIKRNKIFEDIIRIINIVPGSDKLDNLNFNKIMIMADADTHGYHITNIVIGNLYLLCPKLINEGHLYIVMPPLLSMSFKDKNHIYIRNKKELNVVLAYSVYYRYLEIEIENQHKSYVLSREAFVVFCELIIKIGDELRRLSEEYSIPALLLEQLALLTSYINIENPDVNTIQNMLGCEVRHVRPSNLLIFSIGSEDIIVPLNQISELIYTRILPLYREFYYGKNKIYVTTKNTDTFKRSPTSISQLCDIFDKLNNMFHTERYKGLGSMPAADKVINCTNPTTRRIIQITNIGDIDTIFDMLGSDPTERKKLMIS